ncbi:hypothetical protein FRX31_023492 [Thalictrum thalictroides]|uniref:Reverse transcriptase zinc-binding domain-containing protein n=1 Tax=Thalictrum thalictroides TaxID=46969 RepID=A0A7J6VQ78_THATH|nr:hypothetical protein FRX31_023492 [Thalictrum thalictroides]
MVWIHSDTGLYSVAGGVEHLRSNSTEPWWASIIWKKAIHPRLSGMACKIFQKRVPFDNEIQKWDVQLASRCYLCHKEVEDLNHIIWECNVSIDMWKWLSESFDALFEFNGFRQAMDKFNNAGSFIRDIWQAGVIATMVEIWKWSRYPRKFCW